MNHHCFHAAWGSLALDYLAIQASSISVECTFSAGGITISKCCNQLGGDIVEALLFMKSALQGETLFRDIPSSTNKPMLVADESDDNDSAALEEGFGVWDACLADELDEGEDDEDIEGDFSSLFAI
jgi:hypothetical protein